MDTTHLIIQLIFSVGLAVGTSFFCSISEAAFYSIPMGYVERLKGEGRKSGIYLSEIRHEMNDYIASILILNTLANTFGVYKAGAVSLLLLENHPTILSLFPVVMTVIILVFAELIPKTLGVQYNRQFAPFLATPFVYITWLFRKIGLIWLAKSTTIAFTNDDESAQEFSSEELESIAKLSAEEGSIDHKQRDLIKHILSLSENTIKKVLTPRSVMKSLEMHMSVKDVFTEKKPLPYSRIPIYVDNSENIKGIVLLTDLYQAMLEGAGEKELLKFKRPVEFVPESMKLDTLLKKFLGESTHIVMVVDEYGGIAGLVTLEDLLEEVVGEEIIDETDHFVDMQEKARIQSRALQEIIKKGEQ